LFSSFRLGPYTLKNRLVALPVFSGYALPDGRVSDRPIDHYRTLPQSGVTMVVLVNPEVAAHSPPSSSAAITWSLGANDSFTGSGGK
jgi:2,4-dienoyl-CoA reductase-like NADH-dependent reductase (Old Yellow Enzyme family)